MKKLTGKICDTIDVFAWHQNSWSNGRINEYLPTPIFNLRLGYHYLFFFPQNNHEMIFESENYEWKKKKKMKRICVNIVDRFQRLFCSCLNREKAWSHQFVYKLDKSFEPNKKRERKGWKRQAENKISWQRGGNLVGNEMRWTAKARGIE